MEEAGSPKPDVSEKVKETKEKVYIKLGLKKLKFYDNCFKVLGVSFIAFVLGIMLFSYTSNLILALLILLPFGLAMFISLVIITWGMIYHEYKRKEYGWFLLTLVAFFFIGGFIISIIFYFVKMRDEFKKGKGVYEDKKSTEKEKQQARVEAENYIKHKEEIDKKEAENFKSFLKWVGILIVLFILAIIVKTIFF